MGAPHPVPTEPHAEGTASFFLSPRPGQGKGLTTGPNSWGVPPLPSPCPSPAHLSSDSSGATLRKGDFCWVEAQPPLGPLRGHSLCFPCVPPTSPPSTWWPLASHSNLTASLPGMFWLSPWMLQTPALSPARGLLTPVQRPVTQLSPPRPTLSLQVLRMPQAPTLSPARGLLTPAQQPVTQLSPPRPALSQWVLRSLVYCPPFMSPSTPGTSCVSRCDVATGPDPATKKHVPSVSCLRTC